MDNNPELPTKRRFPFKWLFVILLTSAIVAGLFWYVNQSGYYSFPLPTIGETELVTIKNVEFKDPLKKFWKEHSFKSHTSYQVEGDTLHAMSKESSSMLYQPVRVERSDRPFLTWEWKAVQFPANKQPGVSLADKSNNDFVGRVYALFKGRTPMAADVIQYVWDEKSAEGTSSDSPFLKNVRIFVVQSGSSADWVTEKRDVLQDYQTLFGKRPRWPLSAVGVMSDSDNTGTRSEIYFRNFTLKKPKSTK